MLGLKPRSCLVFHSRQRVLANDHYCVVRGARSQLQMLVGRRVLRMLRQSRTPQGPSLNDGRKLPSAPKGMLWILMPPPRLLGEPAQPEIQDNPRSMCSRHSAFLGVWVCVHLYVMSYFCDIVSLLLARLQNYTELAPSLFGSDNPSKCPR